MRYICDYCFDLWPSGSINDIPETVLPTIASECSVCLVMVPQGLEPTGHICDDQLPVLFPPIMVSGSFVSGSFVTGSF